MNLVSNLVVNPELYSPVFSTSNNLHFDLIKNHLKTVIPKSKTKSIYYNLQDIILVYKEYYEKALDSGIHFLQQNNVESEVSWFNKNGILIPCGFYEIAVAYSNIERKNQNELQIPKEIRDYCIKISEFTKTAYCLRYDYLTNSYLISLKGTNFDELSLELNEFILENKTGPFTKILGVTPYGEITENTYPKLEKRK